MSAYIIGSYRWRSRERIEHGREICSGWPPAWCGKTLDDGRLPRCRLASCYLRRQQEAIRTAVRVVIYNHQWTIWMPNGDYPTDCRLWRRAKDTLNSDYVVDGFYIQVTNELMRLQSMKKQKKEKKKGKKHGYSLSPRAGAPRED